MAEYWFAPVGYATGPGSGTSAAPWIGTMPNGVLQPGDIVNWRNNSSGEFPLASTLSPPTMVGGGPTARVLHRGEGGVKVNIKCVGNAYLSFNKSYQDFSNFRLTGANLFAADLGPILNNCRFSNFDLIGTNPTAAAVFLFEAGDASEYVNIEMINFTLSGTSKCGIRWTNYDTSEPGLFKNITVDGFVSNDFVSQRAAIQFLIGKGAPLGSRMENIRVNGQAYNTAGIAFEFSDGEDRSAGIYYDLYVDGIMPVAPEPGNPTNRLGGALGIAGFSELNGVPNMGRLVAKNIVGIGGGLDTFTGEYEMSYLECDNIRSEPGYVDGSAVIADTGTRKLLIHVAVIRNIYGDPTSGPDFFAGGSALTILQGAGVEVRQMYADNCRIGIIYGSPVINGGAEIDTMTVSGRLVTVNTKTPHGRTTGDRVYMQNIIPVIYRLYFTCTVTGPTSFTYLLASDPSGPPTSAAPGWAFGYYMQQSSVVKNATFSRCTVTGWYFAPSNEQLNNHVLEGSTFNMVDSTLPLFTIQYAGPNKWTKERYNFYSGSAKQDPNGRYKLTTNLIPTLGKAKKGIR